MPIIPSPYSNSSFNRPFVRASSASSYPTSSYSSSSYLPLPINRNTPLLGFSPVTGFSPHYSRQYVRSASREVSLSPGSAASWRNYKPSAIVRPNTIINPLSPVSPINHPVISNNPSNGRSTRSRTPILHSCTSRSPSPMIARRVYPQYAPNVSTSDGTIKLLIF